MTTNLQQALANRAVIDRATGIIISRTGSTADEAFNRLKNLSQKGHLEVAAVAAGIVEAAARRAQGRTRSGTD